MSPRRSRPNPSEWTGFARSVRSGFLLGAAVLMIALPNGSQNAAIASTSPEATVASPLRAGSGAAAAASGEPAGEREFIRVAHFGQESASADARHVANWALHSGDNEGRAVVVVDKKHARVFVFSPEGRLLGATAALLGSMVGDHTVPGVGDKPISQVRPDERTTPAGRFLAEPGLNAKGEDVVWVDYDAAVSMHRVRANVKSERRLQRLASPTVEDNRISYGCINLPKSFYETVLSPTVRKGPGAVIYVLPETQSPPEVFGSYEVPNADILALFANPSR